jgi:RimJ/RimL family protein N-acetyltransferase
MQTLDVHTNRLLLRPWAEADAAWYVGAIDEEILHWTREPDDLTVEDWIACLPDVQSGRSQSAAITSDTALVGNMTVTQRRHAVEISYWISAEARGMGYASEALSATTDWVSDNLGPIPLYLEISPDNAASIAVAKRTGYTFSEYRLSTDRCADDLGRVAVYRRTT